MDVWGPGEGLGQRLVLGDGGRGGAAGRAARVAQRLVETLGRVRARRHFTLLKQTVQ